MTEIKLKSYLLASYFTKWKFKPSFFQFLIGVQLPLDPFQIRHQLPMVVTMTIYFQIAAPAVCNDNNIYEVSSIHYCDSKSPLRYALLSTISVIFFILQLNLSVTFNPTVFLFLIENSPIILDGRNADPLGDTNNCPLL